MLNPFARGSIVAAATSAYLAAHAAAAATDTLPRYPELPVAKNYVQVAQVAAGALDRKLQLPPEARAATVRYIFHRLPVREFEALMMKDAPDLQRG